jgi:DnaT-like ssDNA binding protein
MFEFKVETGAGLPDSTSYVSLAEADAYFATHPYYSDNWSDLGIPDRERLLMSGTYQLDVFIAWEGDIVNPTQALGWPRSGVTDQEGRDIPANVVPNQVKISTCEMAIWASKGDPYAASSNAGLERLKIDVIELEWGANASSMSSASLPPRALLALMGLGEYTYGYNVRKVLVG